MCIPRYHGWLLCFEGTFCCCVVVQQLQTEVSQQVPPVSKAVTSFFDPLKSVPQTPVSVTPTGTCMYVYVCDV